MIPIEDFTIKSLQRQVYAALHSRRPAESNWPMSAGLFSKKSVQHSAGRFADLHSLQAAHELGLQLTDALIIGAAEAGSLLKLSGCT
jgi:hypothetical protein